MDLTRSKGYTLLEIMTVTTLIGILSTMAVASYQSFSSAGDMREAKSMLSAAASIARQIAIANDQGVTGGASAAICHYPDDEVLSVREAKSAEIPAKCTNEYKQTQEVRAFTFPGSVAMASTSGDTVSCFCFSSNARFNQTDKCEACATSSIVTLSAGDKAYETSLF